MTNETQLDDIRIAMDDPAEGCCGCGRHHTNQCDRCEALKRGEGDPEVTADQACEQALNALDQLMVLANKDDTFQTVMANKIFIGQILNRAQLVASFLMAKQQPGLRIIRNG